MASRTSCIRHLAVRRSASGVLVPFAGWSLLSVIVGGLASVLGISLHAYLGQASAILLIIGQFLGSFGALGMVSAASLMLLIEPSQAFACSLTPGRAQMVWSVLPLELLQCFCFLAFLRRTLVFPLPIRAFAASFVWLRRSLDSNLRFSNFA